MISRRRLMTGGFALPALAQFSPRPNEIPPSAPLPPEKLPPGFRDSAWKISYFHDDDRTSLRLVDIAFAGPSRGFAVGSLYRDGEQRENRVLTSSDGGRTWTSQEFRDVPYSVFTLDPEHVWIAGRKDLWLAEGGGAKWKKFSLPKDCVRVCFITPEKGWAFGFGKIFWATTDGGRHWQKVPESEQLELTSENTSWSAMEFLNASEGMLAGSSKRPDLDEEYLPDWMLPERAARRRLRPSTTALFTTHDAGTTWKSSVTSVFGQVQRVRLERGRGASLFFYGDGFAWPSEVVGLDPSTGKSTPLFRRSDVRVTDFLLLPGGGYLLSAMDPLGRLSSAGLPGKVRFLYSPDGSRWFYMKVDYRAEAAGITLAAVGGGKYVAATDTGMILLLQ